MGDVVAFLHACLDARERQLVNDERVAQAAAEGASGAWANADDPESARVVYGDGPDDWPATSGDGSVVYDEGAPTRAQAVHIAHWDPACVLERVAEARAGIEAVRDVLAYLPQMGGLRAHNQHDIALRLAQPYAGWPGWRDEWQIRPSHVPANEPFDIDDSDG